MRRSDATDWSQLETHVVDGVFRPPMKEGSRDPEEMGIRRSRRPTRNLEPLVARIPESAFHYTDRTRTYKTTHGRLRPYIYGFSIILTEDDEDLEIFQLTNVSRIGRDWQSMQFRSGSGYRLVILNNDIDPVLASMGDIAITTYEGYWTAEFEYTPARRKRVEEAGFKWDAIERRWSTRDPRAAAVFDTRLRRQIEEQRKSIALDVVERIPLIRSDRLRRPVFNTRRSGFRSHWREQR